MAKAKRKPGRRHKVTPERVAKILAAAEKPKPGALRDRVVELRRVPAGELVPNPKNWRRHPKAQRDALAGLLREVGFAGALLARQDGDALVLIDGHLRQETNPTDVLPVLVTDLSEGEADLLLASFDPLGAMAEADKGQLAALLASLKPEDEAVKGLLEHVGGEKSGGRQGATDRDAVPEVPSDAITQPGDVWLLGDHKLLCGSATVADDVARVMEGEEAVAVLTDPPYGINQPGVPNDAPEGLSALVKGAVENLPVRNAVTVAFASTRTFPVWLDAVRSHGHAFERMLWMYKAAQCTFPWRGWILTSESILVSCVGEGQWCDARPFAHDCYYLPAVQGELDDAIGWHGSVKPMAVVSDLLGRIAPRGTIVFDPFLGSGTTLIAAEELSRRCRGIEIEPKYCDVIVRRWEAFTGKKAERVPAEAA